MIPFEDWSTLSQLYHLNSEPWLNNEAYQQAASDVECRNLPPKSAALALPAPVESPLGELIRRRSSCRQYQRRSMPPAVLSNLLSAAYGQTRRMQLPDETTCYCRSVPSAGGLYPLEIYALTQRVEGLAEGLHHYDVWNHALEPIRPGSAFADYHEALLAYPFVQEANVVLFLAAVFARTQRKYGARGYRYILLEAGHSAQNICLAAAHEGLGSLCIGGYHDGKLNRMLGLDSPREGVVYVVAAGYPA